MRMQTLKMNDGFASSDRTLACLQEFSLNTDAEKERLAGAGRALRTADTEETEVIFMLRPLSQQGERWHKHTYTRAR